MSDETPVPVSEPADTPTTAPSSPVTPTSTNPESTGPVSTDPVAADAPVSADAAPSTAAPTDGQSATGDTSALPPAPDEVALLEALKQVVDPELFVNIVDLGLIYAIQEADHKVSVDMTLTSPACPAGPQIISQSKQALEALPGVAEATIKLVMTPPWSPDRMTDEARDQLGIF